MNAYLYILDTMSDWEIGYLTAEINTGRFFDKSKPKVNLIKIGSSLNPITSMGGMTILPDKTIDDITFLDGDILILPGADTWSDEKNHKVIELIEALLSKNVTIAAICGATIALASTGLLNNKKHTSNNKGYLKMVCPNYTGDPFYVEQSAVTDKNLITASGLAPLEFTYEIFNAIKVMKPVTLEAWFNLHKSKDEKYFYMLMESLQ